ncbi:MAG TPA: TRAP transporter large permease [Deltaproteobacteria bacterium]|jgi:tripartite ATP-independent transporter DctM subunit|nr:TRAP transporter large permease [Deltaproteobacteria bacterium]MDI9543214.1 TRAP transporter large permease [Pseudomonadota bacterium]HOD72378.1 TRAP transporter large permease [Deltaproteobacteria bacterium]HOE73440.1 TRAP transporter large permease [Deltaproteobacteria bacterium]HON60820.1 TRAP transporter large permease [Deltaproteobacteria bacterium]
MSPTTVGIIGIIALFVLIFSRMPVGFLMAIIGFAGFAAIVSVDASLNLLAKDIFSVFASYNLTVIPLFVLMGQIAFHSGISQRLFDTAYRFIGHLPGGLAIATVGACAAFSAICGSTNATAATMGAATLPEMKRYNYKPELATGVVAAGGSLGILIPPSVIFIVYGILTEQSIGELFLAGILPGVLLTLFFVAAILIWATVRPELGPKGPKSTWKQRFASLPGTIETLIIFIVVMGGLFGGIFTPTEAGAVGAFATLAVAVIKRNIDWSGFVQALFETTRISAMILVIVAGATVFGHFLAVSRIPYDIASWIASFQMPPAVIMSFIILIYLIGGCFIDSLALIMLTIPIFYPVVIDYGFDPIWFGVVIVLITQIGVVTPPVGVNVYVVSGVARDVPLSVIFKGVVPMLIAMIILTFLLIPFPQIATFLPGLLR